MIAARCTPFGRWPLRSAVLICSSVHEPMPVSLSCVMFEAVTLNGGSSHDNPLDRSRSKIGAPRSPLGVWQFWQVMMVLTRYLPRSTGVWAESEPVAASSAATTSAERNCMQDLHRGCATRLAKASDRWLMPRRPSTSKLYCLFQWGRVADGNKKGRPKPPLHLAVDAALAYAAAEASSPCRSATGPES